MNNTKKSGEVINQFLSWKKMPNIMQTMTDYFSLTDEDEVKSKANDFKEYFTTAIENIKHDMLGEKFDIDESMVITMLLEIY